MTDQEREMLTIAEAATVAGYSPRTIRNYITRGLLPAYRSVGGRKIRIKRADVDALFVLIPVNPDALVVPDSLVVEGKRIAAKWAAEDENR